MPTTANNREECVEIPRVNDNCYPKLYAQAQNAARSRKFLCLTLLGGNIIFVGIPAFLDLLKALHIGHNFTLEKVFIFLAAITTLLVVFLLERFQKDWLGCRRIAAETKSISWKYMMKVLPYSCADEDAKEMLIKDLEHLTQKSKEFASVLTTEKVSNSNTGDLGRFRELELGDRVQIYREERLHEQLEAVSEKSKKCQSKFWLLSGWIVALQIATFFVCDYERELPVAESVALLIAITIGLLGWRDARKYSERSLEFAWAAQQLTGIDTRFEIVESEDQFRKLVSSCENVVNGEHQEWVPSNDAKDVTQKGIGRYRQRPVEISAIRVESKTTVETLEGTEEASSGDWIITGINGEQWPISNSTFEKKYKPVRDKPGRFRKLPVDVEAAQMNSSFTIDTRWGTQKGKPGDWIVFTDTNDSYVCEQSIFSQSYEVI